MAGKIIPSITAEVLAASSGIPVADTSLEVISILGTFSRGPLNTPINVSDVAQAALQFGNLDDTSKANFLTGMWAVKLAMDQGALTFIRSPALMNVGTVTVRPVSNLAGFPELAAVCPLTLGSVSVTSSTTLAGNSTLNGCSL